MRRRRVTVARSAVVCVALGGVVVGSACAAEDDPRGALEPIPTRTVPVATPEPVSAALDVDNFTVLPNFECLNDSPARAVVSVGWSAPTATDVTMSLDGSPLPVGIQDALPYQVPAGGPTGIGAAVVFACDGSDRHTIDVEWSAPGTAPVARTVTVTKELGDV